MTIISFIFHFMRDLMFMPKQSEGIIRVQWEVKNKGYESHPIRNSAWLQVLRPQNIKKESTKNQNASQNNSVPLELGKQHDTGEKWMNGQTRKVSAQVWTFPGSWRMSACQGVNYKGSFDFFLICISHQLWDQILSRMAGSVHHQ